MERQNKNTRQARNKSRKKQTGRAQMPYALELVNRTVDILDAFSLSQPELTLSELVEATKLPKTTVFRIISNLVGRNICEQNSETGKYSLGLALLAYANIRQRQVGVRKVALPVMREIRDKVRETVVLSIRTGDFRIHIDFVDGLYPLRRMVDLGVQVPLYVGAAGKAILSSMSDEAIEAYLQNTPLKRFQVGTITDPKILWREIHTIRERGYAESEGELIAGGKSIAAPILNSVGEAVGVIDVLTPLERWSPQHGAECRRLLLDGVRKVARQLGYDIKPD